MGTSNIIQYMSDPILNQKNAVNTMCSITQRKTVIVLQRGTDYSRAKWVFGRYAAWCPPLYGVCSCVKRNSKSFVLLSRRRCQALCSHEAASGLHQKLYNLLYLCAQILQVFFIVTWHVLSPTAQITHFGQLKSDNHISCALDVKLLHHEYVARALFLKGKDSVPIPWCRREESYTVKYYASCPNSPSGGQSQAILVYKWRKSTVYSNLPLTAKHCEIKIIFTPPVRFYSALPVWTGYRF